jgi:hypothetical protein
MSPAFHHRPRIWGYVIQTISHAAAPTWQLLSPQWAIGEDFTGDGTSASLALVRALAALD